MDARYEGAYLSSYDGLNLHKFFLCGKSTDVGGANSRLLCLEGGTLRDSCERKEEDGEKD